MASGRGRRQRNSERRKTGWNTGARLDLDDEALFALVKTGSSSALASLIKRHELALLRRIAAQMHRSLHTTVDAGDILQDAAIVALRSLSRTSSSHADELLAWIAGIAINRVRRLARGLRPRARPRHDTSLPPSFLVQVPNDVLEGLCAPDAGVEARDPCATRLQGLRPDDRLVLVLRERLGLAWETVAFVVGRRIDATRMLYLRAARRLQNCMPQRELAPSARPGVIECAGARVRTWLNDEPCVDLDDARGARAGIVALQVHSGGPTEVRFRNLRLELLPAR